jgi:hypothetical protein
MTKEFKISSSQKLLNSSFIWSRLDNSYSCVGGVDLIGGLYCYCRQKGMVDEVLGHDVSKYVEDYFKKERIELSNNIVEDHCKQYYDVFKGTILVESRRKGEAIKHKIRISDLVSKDSTEERKNASLRSMNFNCDCLRTYYQSFLTVPRYVREAFDDYRESDSIPSPHVRTVMDVHSVTAMDWLVEGRGCEGFGIFGLSDHTIGIAKYVIKTTLDSHIPQYELNLFLRDKTVLFNPLRERLGIKLIN